MFKNSLVWWKPMKRVKEWTLATFLESIHVCKHIFIIFILKIKNTYCSSHLRCLFMLEHKFKQIGFYFFSQKIKTAGNLFCCASSMLVMPNHKAASVYVKKESEACKIAHWIFFVCKKKNCDLEITPNNSSATKFNQTLPNK